MIVEICENKFKHRIFDDEGLITHLSPLFNFIGIVQPQLDEVQLTREGGFNLFLNEYNAVLRFYPRPLYLYKIADNDEHIPMFEHLYHPRILPYIGCVNFENFTMQLMPGVANCDELCHSIKLRQEFCRDFNDDIDCISANVGYISPLERSFEKAVLLDTICTLRHPQKYHNQLKNEQNAILENYARYQDLQQEFYNAWTSESCEKMRNFWDVLKSDTKKNDRLFTGWLDNSVKALQHVNMAKKWFIDKSVAYHKRNYSALS